VDRLVLTVPEAAEALGVSPRSYYAAAARGEVPAIRIGRRLVVPGAALARLLGGEESVGNGAAKGTGPRPVAELRAKPSV
jgi:excisionase family DNA binding protein